MRLAKVSRSADWIKAEYDNQKSSPVLPTISGSGCNGCPAFTSVSQFTLAADKPFFHDLSVTGTPLAFTAIGLPSGIIMSSVDGNLTGSPSVSGEFTSTISAFYPNGDRADQQYSFTITTKCSPGLDVSA